MKKDIPSNWQRHRKQTATPDQIRAVQAGYSALSKADDPRVYIGPQGARMADRERRLRWAWQKLGREVDSFSALTLKEAEYLLDFMAGKPTKLDEKIDIEFKRLNVRDYRNYFDSFCKPRARFSKNQWSFGGRDFDQLNRIDKIHLVEILVNREPAKEAR